MLEIGGIGEKITPVVKPEKIGDRKPQTGQDQSKEKGNKQPSGAPSEPEKGQKIDIKI